MVKAQAHITPHNRKVELLSSFKTSEGPPYHTSETQTVPVRPVDAPLIQNSTTRCLPLGGRSGPSSFGGRPNTHGSLPALLIASRSNSVKSSSDTRPADTHSRIETRSIPMQIAREKTRR